MTVNEIAKNVAPAYIFLNQRFDSNLEDLIAAFRTAYGNSSVGYSYKTNYTPYACKSVERHGCYAEVVSPMEYEYALAMGATSEHIIFNGPYKTDDAIKKAVTGHSIVNADNLADFKNIIRVSQTAGANPRVGLRLNFDIGSGHDSRFGVEPDGREYREILNLAEATGIRIHGLHCHISYTRSLESFRRRANRMIELGGKFDDLEYIDLGGKLFGRMPPEFASQFPEKPPTFEEYGTEIGGIFKAAYPTGSMELIIEPGTALVSDCMMMAARILYLKEVNGKTYAITDATKYDLGFAGENKSPPYKILHTGEASTSIECSIAGCGCIETDILTDNYAGPIADGDVIVYENVGAYTCNLSRNFIKPSLPTYEYDGSKAIMVKPQGNI